MHHLPAKSNLLDSGSETTKVVGYGGTSQLPLCPKPRRLRPPIPEVVKPVRCSKHRQQTNEGRGEILNLISDKRIDGREHICPGCSPTCYSGSPPSRTGNPLVHDVRFIQQMELLSPFSCTTNLSDKFGFNSASPV